MRFVILIVCTSIMAAFVKFGTDSFALAFAASSAIATIHLMIEAATSEIIKAIRSQKAPPTIKVEDIAY